MRKIFYLSIILLFTNANAQIIKNKKPNRSLEVYVKEFDLWLPNFKKYPDTIIRKLNDSVSIKVFLRSPKGSLKFYTYNLKNETLLTGEYADALTVFSTYLYFFNSAGEGKPRIVQFYEPVRYGHWDYNTKKGEIPRKELYLKADLQR